jgi:hypothetical protein
VGIGVNDGVGEDGITPSGDGVTTAVGVGELANNPTFGTVVPSAGAGAGFRNTNSPPKVSRITANIMKPHETNLTDEVFFMRWISVLTRFVKR